MPDETFTEGQSPDEVLTDIADYVCDYQIESALAYNTARLCLMDSLGCALLALQHPACSKLLGPVVPGADMPGGARVPGTPYELDPVQAAFNIGCMIRWLDYNDTWLASEWGHPSDNFGGILAAADFQCRKGLRGSAPLLLRDVLSAAIKAYEIQGVIALENSFNRVGLDHVLLVRIASTAVVVRLFGGTKQDVVNALSNAWIDGGALRTYRHAPNTGSRKSWAAGDATSRAVRLALMTLQGEMGYPTALSAPKWGFSDVFLEGRDLRMPKGYGSYVMENVLFKVSYPAEFHAQTALEAAIQLHQEVINRLESIERISIETQEAAIRIIDKTGPLQNPADRDHCLQYITAVGLINGTLMAEHYEDEAARDPRIDSLREKMEVTENRQYSTDYLDPEKRSIPNSLQVFFADGSHTKKIEVAYPIGHRCRREEAHPLLMEKFRNCLLTRFSLEKTDLIFKLCADPDRFDNTALDKFIDLFVATEL